VNVEETARLLARVQLQDNRQVTQLVIADWHEIIGELLSYDEAYAALLRFRRERPGVYLEAGHLLELAGVDVLQRESVPDITDEIIADSKARALAAAGVSEAEYEAHKHDVGWLRLKFPRTEVEQ
jgi:hypothetical protein